MEECAWHFFLGAAAFGAVVSTTIMFPALPAMQDYFQTTPEKMQSLLGLVMGSLVVNSRRYAFDEWVKRESPPPMS